MTCHKSHKGTALLVSMIILAVISAWAVAINSISGTNVQLAENQRKGDNARACAESGLEVIRFWLKGVSIDGTTDEDYIVKGFAKSLQDNLTANGISNIVTNYNNSAKTINIPAVMLDAAHGRSFSAVITKVNDTTLRLDVTGTYGSVAKTISVNYKFTKRAHTVFDFGVATKGPLQLTQT